MNCDQAFDQMTQRGGIASPDLQAHVAQCRRCREMQETLSPAIGLFESDARRYSEPWIAASDSETELAVQTAVRLSQSSPPSRSRWGVALGYLASVLIGAGLVWGVQLLHPESAANRQTPAVSKCTYLADSRSQGTQAQVVLQNCLACHHVDRNE